MRRYVPVAVLIFIVYVVFSGSLSPYDIAIGSLTAIAGSVLVSKYLIKDEAKALSIRRFLHLVGYAFYYLTVAEFKAHRDVIKIILSRKMPVKPAIVRVPFRASNNYTIVASANSITNTPGTVVVEIEPQKSLYYVHWICAVGLDPETTYKEILEPFERRLTKVFE